MDKTMTDKIDALVSGMATLTADMKHVREKTDAIDNKVQVLNDKSIVTELTGLSAHKRIDEITLNLQKRLDEIMALVTKHETIFIEQGGGKKAVSGIWAIVIAVFSAIGSIYSLLFK